MKTKAQVVAAALLLMCGVAALCAGFLAPYSYSQQFRDSINGAPSAAHWLGTDSLGRDLFSRVLYGTRISLLAAPFASLLATLISGVLGVAAGLLGGWFERAILAVTDLLMALPLFFVLIALRAMLPLEVAPVLSITATFLLLGLLGWPSSLRVIWAAARDLRKSDHLLLARAQGVGFGRILLFHVLPNLRPILLAQFWVTIPFFILAETTLSMLGLGVMEPMPSWGNLLRGLEDVSALASNPWRLSPLVLLVAVVLCFQLILSSQEESR